MIVMKNDKILPVDIDGTLIDYVASEDADFYMTYGDKEVALVKKEMNIALVKHHKETRGYYVMVWSANGKEWAVEVIKELGLEKYVDVVMTKPVKYLDDKPCQEWMSNRINLEDV